MARGFNRTDRLIAALGAAVLLLGALILWRVTGAGDFATQPVAERVQRQLSAYESGLVLFDMTEGVTPGVVCGHAGVAGTEDRRLRFVARPNRLLSDRDPLPTEFGDEVARECPRYFVTAAVKDPAP